MFGLFDFWTKKKPTLSSKEMIAAANTSLEDLRQQYRNLQEEINLLISDIPILQNRAEREAEAGQLDQARKFLARKLKKSQELEEKMQRASALQQQLQSSLQSVDDLITSLQQSEEKIVTDEARQRLAEVHQSLFVANEVASDKSVATKIEADKASIRADLDQLESSHNSSLVDAELEALLRNKSCQG